MSTPPEPAMEQLNSHVHHTEPTTPSSTAQHRPCQRVDILAGLLGLAMMGLGAIFLLGRLFRIDVGELTWPLFILVPGVLLYLTALTAPMQLGEVLIIPASIVSMVGALLLYQNTVDHWESWAYVWALVAPTSIGIGQALYGVFKGRDELIHIGRGLISIGGAIFIIGLFFFEFVLNISGFGLGRLGIPLFLIGLGTYVLLRVFLRQQ